MQGLQSVFGGVSYWCSRVRRWCSRIEAVPLREHGKVDGWSAKEVVQEAEAGAVFDCTVALVACVDLIAFIEEEDGSLVVPVPLEERSSAAIFARTGMANLEELILDVVNASEATTYPSRQTGKKGKHGRPIETEASGLLMASMINVIDAQNHLRQVWQQLTVCADCRLGPKSWETPGYCSRCEKETERRFNDPLSSAGGPSAVSH